MFRIPEVELMFSLFFFPLCCLFFKQSKIVSGPCWIALIGESLGNNCLSPKKTQTLKKLHIGTIIYWYWYHIIIRIGTKQPYFGIKIFGQWYQSNLALVLNNTRVNFPRLKMTKLPLFESPKRLKRLAVGCLDKLL